MKTAPYQIQKEEGSSPEYLTKHNKPLYQWSVAVRCARRRIEKKKKPGIEVLVTDDRIQALDELGFECAPERGLK